MPKYMSRLDMAVVDKPASKESSLTLQYPMLTKDNYTVWSIEMKAYLKAQGLWEAIDEAEAETRKDQMALAAIYQAVPDGIVLLLSEKETAREAWEALKSMYLGAESVRDAKLQTLKTEFENLRMEKSETVDDFTVRLTSTVNQIRGLGETIEETYAVKKFLRAASSKFLPILSAIEQFADLKKMTIEEVAGRLKTHEERLNGSSEGDGEQALLTRADWRQ